MKVGDFIHNGIWITGEEPKWMKADYKRRVQESIKELAKEVGAVMGPFKTMEMRPDHWEIGKYLKDPKVPDHIQGPKVRAMIVSAQIVSMIPVVVESSFVNELDPKDLTKLREITQKAYRKLYNRDLPLEECDDVIEALGPEAALENLRTLH